MAALVRGVDVGYGHVKASMSKNSTSGEIRCKAFPSFAPEAKSDHLSGDLSKRDTVVVHVDGRSYEVGPDVENALSRHDTRYLNDDYCMSPTYLALVRGALHYMAVPSIDMLVVGLPVANLFARRNDLIKLLTDLHNVGNSRTVNVSCVKVLAQPIGGFMDYAFHSGRFDQIITERNLIVDPGYFTLDWVVTNGYQIVADRSGSNDGGVFSLIRVIAQKIEKYLRRQYTDYQLIERAVNGMPFYLDGKPHDIKPFVDEAIHVVHKAVIAMKNGIGRHTDIRNIILVGGGAEIFREAVETAFPGYEVAVAKDPVFSNVRGFHLFGEHVTGRKAVA